MADDNPQNQPPTGTDSRGTSSIPSSGGSKSRQTLLAEIDEKVRQWVAASASAQDVQLRLNEYDAARKSDNSVFWDKFVTEPLNNSLDEFVKDFGLDDQAISSAATESKKRLSELVDVESAWAKLETKYSAQLSSEDFSNLEKLFNNPQTEAYIVEQYVSPYAKNELDKDKCENTVISAAFNTITNVLAGAVSNQVRAVYTLYASVTLLTNQISGIGSAFMQMPIQNLLSILVSRDLLIDRIIKISNNLASIAGDMTERDYPFDHPYWLRQEQARLLSAEDKLGRVQGILEAGGAFNVGLWLSAKEDIDAASEALCGANIDRILYGLSLRPLALVGLGKYLQTLVGVLKRQQQIRNLLINSIITFNKNFFELSRFENLFVPIVRTIRCQLSRIDKQMDSAIKRNQFFYYLVKEKEWCIYLKALSALMSVSIKLNLPENINKFLGTELLQNAANKVVDTLNSVTVDAVDSSATGLVNLCNELVQVAKTKATYNIPPGYLQGLASSIQVEGERLKAMDDPVSKVLDIFSKLIPAEAFEAVLIVNQLMGFARSRNLEQFVDAVNAGNLKDAFGVNGLKAAIDQTLTFSLSNYIAQSIAGGGILGEPLREAVAIRQEALDKARAQAVKQRILDMSKEAIVAGFDNIERLRAIRQGMVDILEMEGITGGSGPSYLE